MRRHEAADSSEKPANTEDWRKTLDFAMVFFSQS